MSNENEMVYVKAINGHVLIGGAPLDEGRHRLIALTPAVKKAEAMGIVKTFKTEKEAAGYKIMSASIKALASLHSFSDKPKEPEFDKSMSPEKKARLQKEYELALAKWEEAQKKALLTPFGDPTERAMRAEREANADLIGNANETAEAVDGSEGSNESSETTNGSDAAATAAHKRHGKKS